MIRMPEMRNAPFFLASLGALAIELEVLLLWGLRERILSTINEYLSLTSSNFVFLIGNSIFEALYEGYFITF